ncbi:MAG: FMN-binding protein [Phycisphaeraceae bacterium]|nr:FMN-binding protein [Phycisphaeraceae bacterium]
MACGCFERTTWSVHCIARRGCLCGLLIFILWAASPVWGGQGIETGRVTRTRAEVETLIEQVGASSPDWWDSVKLTYPNTLDMDWPLKAQGNWNNQINVGQYIWDVINPNPGRWKQGIRLVHHLMIKHKNDKAKVARCMQTLGSMFHNFSRDWPRAVFWWRMSQQYGARVDPTRLANCYWQMGCEDMTREMLVAIGYDYSRNGEVIKLWADMGQMDKALQLADMKARGGMPHIAYRTAGDACRQAGMYKKAVAYYQKAVQAPLPAKENNDFTRARQQSQEAIETIRLFELLDLSQIKDDVYTASSTAFAGVLHVEVKVTDHRIESVRVTEHREKQFHTAIEETPRQIVQKQTVKGLDAVTGATITSEAIINAAASALAGAMQ